MADFHAFRRAAKPATPWLKERGMSNATAKQAHMMPPRKRRSGMIQGSDLMLRQSLTRARAAGYSIMALLAGVFAMPLIAHAQGDAAAGEKVFAHCVACHSNKAGENKVGPSLAGVFGRKSGTEPGYNYSSAMKGVNITWDEKTLDEYLQGPGMFVRGTKMVYLVPDEKDRQDVIAYLKTLSK
jgi:cytochrome c